jgi:lysophospholipase
MGTSGGTFNYWYIEDKSNGTSVTFDKRSDKNSIDRLATRAIQRRSSGINPEAVFPEQDVKALVEEFNATFGEPLSQISYAWYPNPFKGLPSVASDIRDLASLRLVDGSENGQSIPLWSQIQPERNSSFIIFWDDSTDAPPYFWNNGTNLYNTYLRANEVGIPFPVIPSASTFVVLNYTVRPVFFGCDPNLTTTKDTRSPIVAYFANAPYNPYTNINFTQTNTSAAQINEIWTNSFNQLTPRQ